MNDPWLGPIVTKLPPADPAPAQEPRRRAWRYVGGLVGLAVYILPTALVPGNPIGSITLHGLGLLSIVLFIPVLPHMSYRKRDCLLLLVPFWGFAYAWTFGSRAALLPYRDWRPREDEMSAARSTPHAPLWTRAAADGG